jgi:hypothetical protein
VPIRANPGSTVVANQHGDYIDKPFAITALKLRKRDE